MMAKKTRTKTGATEATPLVQFSLEEAHPTTLVEKWQLDSTLLHMDSQGDSLLMGKKKEERMRKVNLK